MCVRSDDDIAQAREAMEARIDRDEHPILLLIWQSKRDALGAVLNEGKNPSELRQSLWQTMRADLTMQQYVKVQSAINVFSWITEQRSTI
jgi:hypothetical protein